MGPPETSTTTALPAKESRRLIACPRCGYRLHGLATIHPCPECGTLLDRRWEMLGPAGLFEPAPFRYVPFLIWLGLALGLGVAAIGSGRLVILLIPLAFAAWKLLRQWHWHLHRGDFIALGPDGLVWDRVGTGRCTIPWCEIKSVRRRPWTTRVDLHLRDGRRLTLPLGLLYRTSPDRALSEHCIARIEAHRR